VSRASLLLAAALAAACGGSSAPPSASPSPPAGTRFDYNGITHVSWWHDEYGSGSATDSRAALAGTGAGGAGVLVTWYMDDVRSSDIAPDPNRSNDDAVVRRAVEELHARGLKVMLKPHVDVQDGTWRAQIAPRDPARWFASYGAFLDHYVALARDERVEMICIGTELASMSGSQYAAQWSALVARIRGQYSGLLTYAANGVSAADEFTSVSFWSQLDLLGADVYTPLTDKKDPTRQELAAGWRSNRDGHDMLAAFHNWQQSYGKPFVFTEVGYRSADGANRAPWDYSAAAPADDGEQADCYAALYDVWLPERGWMKGPFWWAWDVSAPGPGDTGYNPRGKPAEAVLRQGQSGQAP
jgi:glycosyl hydrolase family 113